MSKKKLADLSMNERAAYASRIKALRQGAEMTQAELGKLAEVSRATVVGIEGGNTVPQAEVLARVLRVLGVDIDETAFDEQTELWLAMMGALIEAIPEPRREPAVHSAMRALSEGLKPHVSAAPDTEDLHSVDLKSEFGLAATHDNTGIDPSRGES